jgi:hypothetical protein
MSHANAILIKHYLKNLLKALQEKNAPKKKAGTQRRPK